MDNKSLVVDLLEWIANRPRAYDDVMEAWRTSCPRLTIWEDTVDAGLVTVRTTNRGEKIVTITEKGRVFLERSNRYAER